MACVACVRRCVQGCLRTAYWLRLPVCGTSCGRAGLECILRLRVRCAVRGLLACAVLGDTRHDADVPLCWVGLVASCVSARTRVRGLMVAVSATLASWYVREVFPKTAKMWTSWLRCHARTVEHHRRSCFDAVTRVLCRSIAIADLCCRVSAAAPRLAVADV